ncbi:conserved protein of unknown function [Thermococcus nautili]|uniref:hypothetical protein n=1 Tax=Thermococcus nautili TaxID=195522 RepID=UPI0025547B6A|nr:hypothetical protein [Thermococcus nautili]CAI1492063.1 conserved protein of unknown function [Thermococcus nautili]
MNVNGVNLIDFTMPSAVPTPAGGKVRNVGGMKLILPEKSEEKKPAEGTKERKVNWKALLFLVVAFFIFLKLVTGHVRRYGK